MKPMKMINIKNNVIYGKVYSKYQIQRLKLNSKLSEFMLRYKVKLQM